MADRSHSKPFGSAIASPRLGRVRGLLVVAYLLTLLQAFAAIQRLLPRVRWLARVDRRWTDLWMR
jgi:hypothetical protein